jgi:hypothetical protein
VSSNLSSLVIIREIKSKILGCLAVALAYISFLSFLLRVLRSFFGNNTVCPVTAFWVVLTVNVTPSITTSLEVTIGTGISDGTGDWAGDCYGAGDPTGVSTVGTGLGIGVGTVGSGSVASGSDVEDDGMEISSLSP